MLILIEFVLLFFSLLCWSFYIVISNTHLIQNENFKSVILKYLEYLNILFLIMLLVNRYINEGLVVLSGVYITLIIFSLLYSVKILFYKFNKTYFAMPLMLAILACLILPFELKKPSIIMPALKSVWIYFHVPFIFLSYVSLIIGFIMLNLRSLGKIHIKREDYNNEIKIAFFFLTIGIITGSFWGEDAWGCFWNWDPKEIWALITWLVLSLYFHLHSEGNKLFILYLSVFSMLFTYFGVTFLLPSLHSYL